MVSSKLTIRRATVKKPPVCKKAPVPLVPIPPPAWPPQTFDLLFVTDYVWGGLPIHFEHTYHLTRIGTTWDWYGVQNAPPYFADCAWNLHTIPQTADLHIRADNPPVLIVAKAYSVPVTWDAPTVYHITVWSSLIPWNQVAVADFTF